MTSPTPAIKDKLSWELVCLVGLVLGAIVGLVALGQPLSALVAAAVTVAGVLGINIVQGAVQKEQTAQVKELANGNLAAMREQLEKALNAAAVDRERAQLANAQQQAFMVQLAAKLPANTPLPELPPPVAMAAVERDPAVLDG